MNSWSIIEGDCIEVLETVSPGTIRLVFADPPYNLSIDYGAGAKADRLPAAEYISWCGRSMASSVRPIPVT